MHQKDYRTNHQYEKKDTCFSLSFGSIDNDYYTWSWIHLSSSQKIGALCGGTLDWIIILLNKSHNWSFNSFNSAGAIWQRGVKMGLVPRCKLIAKSISLSRDTWKISREHIYELSNHGHQIHGRSLNTSILNEIQVGQTPFFNQYMSSNEGDKFLGYETLERSYSTIETPDIANVTILE